MSVAEVNFRFNGLHCLRDFGCIFIGGKSRIVSPATADHAYTIAGLSGTLRFRSAPDIHTPYSLSGVLVPMKTPASLQSAQALARRISAWLKSGRGVLAWDYEPMQQHVAEVIAPIEWETSTWMDGGLAVTFLVQPYTYDMMPTIRRAAMASGSGTLLVPVATVLPCPVSLRLTNAGDAPITRIRVSTDAGKAVEMGKGMALAPGAVLALSMEAPISAAITAGEASANALPYAVQFDQLTLSGPGSLTIEADGSIDVEASARGCML